MFDPKKFNKKYKPCQGINKHMKNISLIINSIQKVRIVRRAVRQDSRKEKEELSPQISQYGELLFLVIEESKSLLWSCP